jgi:hypothetical protein
MFYLLRGLLRLAANFSRLPRTPRTIAETDAGSGPGVTTSSIRGRRNLAIVPLFVALLLAYAPAVLAQAQISQKPGMRWTVPSQSGSMQQSVAQPVKANTSQPGTITFDLSNTGIAGPGSSSSVEVQFASTPGSTSTVVLAATFQSTLQDISNSLQLGLIDNQGIANSLSRKINVASVAAGGGDNTTAANVLRAFTNEVKRLAEDVRDGIDEAGKPGIGDDRERREAEHRQRQDKDREHTGKHITGIAPQVLLADAAHLISQLR